ncbi:MAG TPA: hypothetical protein VFF73_03350, partial [Planctomycetota bacterium]|nr:hypothetical protein [Planctomycetota bacterium]
MDVRDRVRVTLLVGLVVLFVGVVVFDVFKTQIWVAVHARRLWDEDPAVRDEAASALLRQGARGQAALERVAFSRKIAEPGTRETAARQAAMNVLLWRDFCWGSNLGNVPLITRYLREGRGLERLKV